VRLPSPPLLVITDRHQARRPLPEIAAALFAGGCRWLSLREKDLAAAERLALLQSLVELGRPYGAVVGVHDDVAAAAATEAALHLPDGVVPAEARRRLGAKALIGASCHDAAGIARAAAAGADYATLSPIFVSTSKPGYGPALGLAALAAVSRVTTLPIIALGGIDEAVIAEVIASGAAGAAVMGAAMTADDPQSLMAALVAHIGAALAARQDGSHSPPR